LGKRWSWKVLSFDLKKHDTAENGLDQSILFEGSPKGSWFFFWHFISLYSVGKREREKSLFRFLWHVTSGISTPLNGMLVHRRVTPQLKFSVSVLKKQLEVFLLPLEVVLVHHRVTPHPPPQHYTCQCLFINLGGERQWHCDN